MNSSAKSMPAVLVDAVGAVLFGACVVACAYLVFFHSEHAGSEVREFTSLIQNGTQDLAGIRSTLLRQRDLVRDRHEELESRGQLPASIPIEEYLRTLSLLAAQNHLRIVRQNPLTRREYPGLVEQLYAYDVVGAMPDLARFFKAVEDAELWADIAYLRIENVQEPTDGNGQRLASLTVSLFSGQKPHAGSTPEGG
jgi:Tfp pilus assembly protein PilO